MRSRLVRLLLTLTTLAVVWLVTTPAHAMGAPLCDPRGATILAPAPQMQEVEVSLESSVTLDECLADGDGQSLLDAGHAAPGRAPLPDEATASADTAAVNAVLVTLARSAPRELLPVPAASTRCSRPGFRSTVDRPPRA